MRGIGPGQMLANLHPSIGGFVVTCEVVATGGRDSDTGIGGFLVKGQLALRGGVLPHHLGVGRALFLQGMGFGHPGLGQAEGGFGLATVSLMGAVEGLACLLPQCAGRGEIGGGHLLRLGDELVASGDLKARISHDDIELF